jgi:hypothetical protein
VLGEGPAIEATDAVDSSDIKEDVDDSSETKV